MRADLLSWNHATQRMEVTGTHTLVDGIVVPDSERTRRFTKGLWVGAPDRHLTYADGEEWLRAMPEALAYGAFVGAEFKPSA